MKTVLLSSVVTSAVLTVWAGPAIWVDENRSPTEPATVVANWGIFDLDVGVTYQGVSVTPSIGHLLCTANFEPNYPVTDPHGNVFYPWSNSGNWDSVALTIAHIKRVYDFLRDPRGLLMEERFGEYNDERGLDTLTTAGPNNQGISIGISDLPIVPPGVEVNVGTTLKFDVRLQGSHIVRLDQGAEIENLEIGSGAVLLCDVQNRWLCVQRGLFNAGTLAGHWIRWVKKGFVNEGSFHGSIYELEGGLVNRGSFWCGVGEYRGEMENNGTMVSYWSSTFVTPRLFGSGRVLNQRDLVIRWDGASPGLIEQPIESYNGHLGLYNMRTAPGVTIRASGAVLLEDGSYHVVAAQGETLLVQGHPQPGSLIEATGPNTRLNLWLSNAGTIRILNNVTATILDSDTSNSGIIELQDSSLTTDTPQRFYAAIPSTGLIRLSNSTLYHGARFYYQRAYRKFFTGDGTGRLQFENNSVWINPEAEYQRIFIDASSRVYAEPYQWVCRMGDQVTNEGEIYAGEGSIYLYGSLVNRGTIGTGPSGGMAIHVHQDVENHGSIVNSGTMDITASGIRGSGSLTSTGLLRFYALAPGQLLRIAQPVFSSGAMHGDDLRVESGGRVQAAGDFFAGTFEGPLEVIEGRSLRVSAAFYPMTMAQVHGTATSMLFSGSNAGEINVADGGRLDIWDFLIVNTGRIHIENGSTTFPVIMWQNNSAELRNDGTIELTRGQMEFMTSGKFVSGNGTLMLRDHSILRNPVVMAGTVEIDADSSVSVMGAGFESTLRGNVVNRGTLVIQGRFSAGGNWRNEGAIRSYASAEFRCRLINDGSFLHDSAAGFLILDVDRISGSGTMSLRGGPLYFRATVAPDRVMTIAHPISVEGDVWSETFFRTETGFGLEIGGSFYGQANGSLRARPGSRLRVDLAELESRSETLAVGNGTCLDLIRGINRGHIEVREGALLGLGVSSKLCDFVNAGRMTVIDGPMTNGEKSWGPMRLHNQGTIQAIRAAIHFTEVLDFQNDGPLELIESSRETRQSAIGGAGRILAQGQSRITNLGTSAALQVHLDGTSQLSYIYATRTLNGPLISEGPVRIHRARLSLASDWILGTPASGSLTAEDSELNLGGHWSIRFRDPADFRLENTTIRFFAAAGDPWLRLEVGGIDYGNDPRGWTSNFAIGTLELLPAARVRLVDEFENADPAPEALYVETLILRDGAILDRGNQGLYWRTLIGHESQIIPEPQTAVLVVVGWCGLHALSGGRRAGRRRSRPL